jgi:hypothetical protein
MGDETVSVELLCEADREGRKIVFFVRENFGDGTDGGGSPIEPDQERKFWHKVLDQAIDCVIGPPRPRVPQNAVERWVPIRYLASNHEVRSRD